MKSVARTLFIALGGFAMAASHAAPELPGCTDSRTQTGARYSLENTYLNAGFSEYQARFHISKLPELIEYQDEAVTRNIVYEWRLRSPKDLRMCRVEMTRGSFLVVMIARNPANPNEIGYVAFNHGLPSRLTVAEGWLRD